MSPVPTFAAIFASPTQHVARADHAAKPAARAPANAPFELPPAQANAVRTERDRSIRARPTPQQEQTGPRLEQAQNRSSSANGRAGSDERATDRQDQAQRAEALQAKMQQAEMQQDRAQHAKAQQTKADANTASYDQDDDVSVAVSEKAARDDEQTTSAGSHDAAQALAAASASAALDATPVAADALNALSAVPDQETSTPDPTSGGTAGGASATAAPGGGGTVPGLAEGGVVANAGLANTSPQTALVDNDAAASTAGKHGASAGSLSVSTNAAGQLPEQTRIGPDQADANGKTRANDANSGAGDAAAPPASDSRSDFASQLAKEAAKDGIKDGVKPDLVTKLEQVLAGPSPAPAKTNDLAPALLTEPRAALPESARAMPPGAVAIEIGLRALQGIKEFQIRLDPAELGRVEVKLEIGEDKSVTAKVVVDRVETLHLLQRDAKTLERAFEQAGLKSTDGGIDITLRDPGQQTGQGRGEAWAGDGEVSHRQAARPGRDNAEQQTAIIRRTLHVGALDRSI